MAIRCCMRKTCFFSLSLMTLLHILFISGSAAEGTLSDALKWGKLLNAIDRHNPKLVHESVYPDVNLFKAAEHLIKSGKKNPAIDLSPLQDGEEAVFIELLKAGLSLNKVVTRRALLPVSAHYRPAFVPLLLHHRADPNIITIGTAGDAVSPLYYAAEYNAPQKIVKCLIDAGAQINWKYRKDGPNALACASYNLIAPNVETLLEARSNLNTYNRGRTPLFWATQGFIKEPGKRDEFMSVARLLISAGCNPDFKASYTVWKAYDRKSAKERVRDAGMPEMAEYMAGIKDDVLFECELKGIFVEPVLAGFLREFHRQS